MSTKRFVTKLRFVQDNQAAFDAYCKAKKIPANTLGIIKQRDVIHEFCNVMNFKRK